MKRKNLGIGRTAITVLMTLAIATTIAGAVASGVTGSWLFCLSFSAFGFAATAEVVKAHIPSDPHDDTSDKDGGSE